MGTEADDKPRSTSRRQSIVTLGALAAVPLVWHGASALWRRLLPPDFDFEALNEPSGFRRLRDGAVSGGFDPLVGIGAQRSTQAEEIDEAELRADLCSSLFGGAPVGDAVPIASFSDYYCPFCRVLTGWLATMEAEMPAAVSIRWHEWPILGETSLAAARAALAARRQGAYARFHAALMRGRFVATPVFLRDLAGRLGIDGEQMLADMESAAVVREIAVARGLARLFAFPGTPALVVGRTVVVGQIDRQQLEALIARERAEGPLPVCA